MIYIHIIIMYITFENFRSDLILIIYSIIMYLLIFVVVLLILICINRMNVVTVQYLLVKCRVEGSLFSPLLNCPSPNLPVN